MKELTKEQTLKYLTQIINDSDYRTFKDFIQHQRNRLPTNANMTITYSDAIHLEFKLKNSPFHSLYIKIDFVNKNMELRIYNVYDNGMTVSFKELYNLYRIEKLKLVLNN